MAIKADDPEWVKKVRFWDRVEIGFAGGVFFAVLISLVLALFRIYFRDSVLGQWSIICMGIALVSAYGLQRTGRRLRALYIERAGREQSDDTP